MSSGEEEPRVAARGSPGHHFKEVRVWQVTDQTWRGTGLCSCLAAGYVVEGRRTSDAAITALGQCHDEHLAAYGLTREK